MKTLFSIVLFITIFQCFDCGLIKEYLEHRSRPRVLPSLNLNFGISFGVGHKQEEQRQPPPPPGHRPNDENNYRPMHHGPPNHHGHPHGGPPGLGHHNHHQHPHENPNDFDRFEHHPHGGPPGLNKPNYHNQNPPDRQPIPSPDRFPIPIDGFEQQPNRPIIDQEPKNPNYEEPQKKPDYNNNPRPIPTVNPIPNEVDQVIHITPKQPSGTTPRPYRSTTQKLDYDLDVRLGLENNGVLLDANKFNPISSTTTTTIKSLLESDRIVFVEDEKRRKREAFNIDGPRLLPNENLFLNRFR